jgi:hypothetical protein
VAACTRLLRLWRAGWFKNGGNLPGPMFLNVGNEFLQTIKTRCWSTRGSYARITRAAQQSFRANIGGYPKGHSPHTIVLTLRINKGKLLASKCYVPDECNVLVRMPKKQPMQTIWCYTIQRKLQAWMCELQTLCIQQGIFYLRTDTRVYIRTLQGHQRLCYPTPLFLDICAESTVSSTFLLTRSWVHYKLAYLGPSLALPTSRASSNSVLLACRLQRE